MIPVGICHGDLTLSNILFRGHVAPTPHTPDEELRRRAMASSGGEWVILIDFLDNFVESPLADLAKVLVSLGASREPQCALGTQPLKQRVYGALFRRRGPFVGRVRRVRRTR
jgi:thiamine kinase-like enzyme